MTDIEVSLGSAPGRKVKRVLVVKLVELLEIPVKYKSQIEDVVEPTS